MTRARFAAGAATMVGSLILALGPLASAGGAEGFTACPEGTTKLVKFEANDWKAEDDSVTAVTLVNPSFTGGSWTSTVPIAAVVVKGGAGGLSRDVILYNPHATSGTYTNTKLENGGGNAPDISFVEFCTAPETTTSSSSSTTTTSTTVPGGTTEDTTGAVVEGATTEIPTEVLGAVETAELPRTGAPAAAGLLSMVGSGLLVGGLGLLVVGRRPERHARS